MTSSLRREAEALVEKLWPMVRDGGVPIPGRLHELFIDHIEAFAKVQRVKEVEAMDKRVRDEISTGRQITGAWMIDWLTQRKKELQP